MEKALLWFLTIFVLATTPSNSQCNFSSSCSSISHTYRGTISLMTASCISLKGATTRSSIDLNDCIGNNDGKLECGSSYFTTCSSLEFDNANILASCADSAGNPVPASLATTTASLNAAVCSSRHIIKAVQKCDRPV